MIECEAKMSRRLEGKTVLVTGAGTGIGSAISLAAAREGADVAVCCHSSGEGARAIRERILSLGRRAVLLKADIGKAKQARLLVKRAVEELGPLHVLVNNAAVVRRASFLDYGEREWEETFAVNLRAAFICTQEAARTMIAQGIQGCIVNVSSVGGLLAHANLCAYDASKAGLDMLTRCTALELASQGIRVNSVVPGAIEVQRTKDEHAGATMVRRWRKLIPLGHRGQPEDIAKAVIFLASDDARFVTGQTLVVDGGQTIVLSGP
jgi:NAD(P)-dependent dehydrogenase (short-subunit alcohol dehydrogenase family)